MRAGLRSKTLSDDRLAYIAQLGVEDVFIDPSLPSGGTGGDIYGDTSDGDREYQLVLSPDHVPSVDRLVELRRKAAEAGVTVTGVHSLKFNMYGDIMFGRDGQEKQLAAIERLIENLGEAEIPILGYQWNPRGLVPMRTTTDARVRGDACSTAFALDDLENPFDPVDDTNPEYREEDLWENYERFLDRVLPVAEDAGVRLALHPADPPVAKQLGGFPRLFRNPQSFERAMRLVPSDNHGLKLCLGCFSQMGEDVTEIVRRFGDDIVFVHFRDVIGTYPSFTETFVDCGNYDEFGVLQALREVGFDGVLVPDHVPSMVDDTEWKHRGRGYTVGYIRGMLTRLYADG